MHSRKNFRYENAGPMENSAFPSVSPMKAALYFDNAIGFGEWRLFMSTHATQDLRDAFKKNADGFKAIVKKME